MNYNPYEKDGKWYKGNLHCHSTLSDGTYTINELKDIYVEHGYSFIAFSDHDVYRELDELNDENFLAYPSTEVKVLSNDEPNSCGDYRGYHMLCLKSKSMKNEVVNETLYEIIRFDECDRQKIAQEYIDKYADLGFLITLNHPIWSRLYPQDLTILDNFFALEIYNSQCAIDGDDDGQGTLYWDILLRQGKKVWGFAADDNHNKSIMHLPGGKKIFQKDEVRWPSCKGWVNVKAKSLTVEDISDSLKNGNFYSSTGPEIFEYYIKDGYVYIKCTEVKEIRFISYERRGYTFKSKNGITKACHRLQKDEDYVRVECIHENGTKAWTNPIFLK